MEIRFFPLDIEYKIVDDKPLIHMFGRTNEGAQVCVLDNILPYLWIIPRDDILMLENAVKNLRIDNLEIVKTEPHRKIFVGKEINCLKVYVKIPAQIPILRKYLEENSINYAEADILFTKRYLIDKEIVPFQEYV